MPDTLRKTLVDRVWTIVGTWFDARPALKSRMDVGNRSRESREGVTRAETRVLPKDFGAISIAVELLGHSGWSGATSLGAKKQNYLNSTADFTVLRDVRLVITIRAALPGKDSQENGPTEEVAIKDEVVNALFAAGPKLGLSFVTSAPPFKVEERDSRDDEKPRPGKVATITMEFQCQQSGRDLLAAITAA